MLERAVFFQVLTLPKIIMQEDYIIQLENLIKSTFQSVQPNHRFVRSIFFGRIKSYRLTFLYLTNRKEVFKCQY